MATCNPQSLMSAAGAFVQMTPLQLMAVRTVLLCQILQARNPMATCDPQTLMTAGKCFYGLGLAELSAIQTQLLCEILQAGGVGGDSCIVCGDVDPVADPGCDCALAYNRQTGGVWQWNDTLTQWEPLISP